MTKKIKATELKRGDAFITDMWGNLWKRVSPHTCVVMSVTERPGGNLNIMVKARENGSTMDYVVDVSATPDTEYTLA